MADRDIAVKFTGDARDLEQASDKAERSVAGASKGMGGALSTLAGPAAILTGAVAGLGAAAFSFADAALEDDAAASQLAHQLQTAAGATDEAIAGAEEYISVLSKTAAVTDDELRPALAKLANATGDTAKAQDLLALATDIAAGTGKDLGTVSDALAKAQLGSTGALSKMGLATKDAAGETMSLEQVLDSARGKFAGAAKAAGDTAAGGLKKAKIGMGELQEEIGAKLLPILGSLGSFLVDSVIPAFENTVAFISEKMGPVVDEIAGGVRAFFAAFQAGDGDITSSGFPGFLEQVAAQARVVFDVVTQVLAVIRAAWAEWGDEVLAVIGFVFGVWVKELQLIMKVTAAILGWVFTKVKEFWDEWGDEIMATVKQVARIVVETVTKVVLFAQEVGRKLEQFWKENGEGILAFGRLVLDLFTVVGQRVAQVLTFAAQAWTAIFSSAMSVILSTVEFALNIIRFLWGMWGGAIMKIVDDVMGIVRSIVQFAMQTIVNTIKFFTAIFRGDWQGAWAALLDTTKAGLFFLGGLMGRIGGIVVDALAGVITIITTPFRIAFNTIADIWNTTVGALSFNFPDWVPGLGGRGIDVPDIARFSTFGAMTIVMPPGSDGYDVARQVQTFSRTVAPMEGLTVAVR